MAMSNDSPFSAMSNSVQAALALTERVNQLANQLCGYPPPTPAQASRTTDAKADKAPVLAALGGEADSLSGAVAAANADLDRIAALLPN